MSQQNAVPDTFYSAVTEKLPTVIEDLSGNQVGQPGKSAAQTNAERGEEHSSPNLSKTLLHVAWMAILLGLIIEILILIIATSFDKMIGGKTVLADLVQKVSWSVIVCIGLALARGATRLFTATTQTVTAGLAGLLIAPAAFAIARSLHEGVQEALFIKVFQSGSGSPVLLALIKGVEYGCLGAGLAWVSKQIWGKALAHAGVGMIVGVVFGALLIGVMAWGAVSPMSFGAVLSRAINEVINPMGCSLTLYSAEILGRTQSVCDSISD